MIDTVILHICILRVHIWNSNKWFFDNALLPSTLSVASRDNVRYVAVLFVVCILVCCWLLFLHSQTSFWRVCSRNKTNLCVDLCRSKNFSVFQLKLKTPKKKPFSSASYSRIENNFIEWKTPPKIFIHGWKNFSN